MKQILQHLRTGETLLEEIPAPAVEPGHVLIRTRRTLVSVGTEKMLVQFGKASLFQKARSQPDKVRQVLAKMRTDGIAPTIEAVFRKLDSPLPLGYCNAGVVIGVGSGVTGIRVGQRVASNGPHAEIVCVPENLVAAIPEGLSDDAAAFAPIAAIAIQGMRLARPELGETFVVIGLGLIGQIAAQLLRAAGCRVIGFDFDAAKVALARERGVDARTAGGESDAVKTVFAATQGLGADGVLITASTESNSVIAESARMSRKRGRIVLIGVVGLNLSRSDFYEKELTFQVSCSYGPGRYDNAYEEKGLDYPVGFVRWTENRNFQAVLGAMASGALNVEQLITRRVPLAEYRSIYDSLGDGLASLLVFDEAAEARSVVSVAPPLAARPARGGSLAVVGAGNFTQMTVMPALATARAPVRRIISASGVNGTLIARRYGIALSGTDYEAALQDGEIGGLIIATRHHLHAAQTLSALAAGKHVLVEKPLCLSLAELRAVGDAVATSAGSVTVGFNRRFSPHVAKIRDLLGPLPGPMTIIATMNAGHIPLQHWVHDPEIGGGRLVGEACHLIDLGVCLARSPVVELSADAVEGQPDTASIILRHANGTVTVVNYLSSGHREVSKERFEIHCNGRTLLLDNFRVLSGYGFRAFKTLKTKQDKGHAAQFAAFTAMVQSAGAPLVPWDEVDNVMRATLAVPIAIAERRRIALDELS